MLKINRVQVGLDDLLRRMPINYLSGTFIRKAYSLEREKINRKNISPLKKYIGFFVKDVANGLKHYMRYYPMSFALYNAVQAINGEPSQGSFSFAAGVFAIDAVCSAGNFLTCFYEAPDFTLEKLIGKTKMNRLRKEEECKRKNREFDHAWKEIFNRIINNYDRATASANRLNETLGDMNSRLDDLNDGYDHINSLLERPESIDDPYARLGIQPNATQDEIQKAYRKVALQCHPDRTRNLPDQERKSLEEKFIKASEAYEILKK